MSTSILPVKAGAKDLVRIGADKRTTSCSPSLVMRLLTEKTGPISPAFFEREMATKLNYWINLVGKNVTQLCSANEAISVGAVVHLTLIIVSTMFRLTILLFQ